MIGVSVDLTELQSKLDQIKGAISDLKPLWSHLYQGLPQWFDKTFQTDGFGNWAATKDRDNPILRDTYKYMESFTEETTDTIDRRSKLRWHYGSNVDYGHFHEEGAEGREQRQVAGELARHEPFLEWVSEQTQTYFQEIINGS